MIPSISCPSCNRALGRVSPDTPLQIECGSCHQRFGVVYGKVSHWSSQRETLFYFRPNWPSLHRRRYEFRLTTPGRDLKVLRFEVPGGQDTVPVHPGDRLSIFFTPQGDRLKKLLAIQNHTIGKHYHLPFPVASPSYLMATRGLLVVIGAVGALLTGFSNGLVYGLGAIACIAYARLVNTATLTTPELRPAVSVEARLLQERRLLEQKFRLGKRMEIVQQECYSHQDLIQRLQALRNRMMQVNPTLYGGRASRIERAVRLLGQRIHHGRLLIDQYGETIRMLDIELETAYLSDHLPGLEDCSGAILHRLAELREAEEQANALRLQIEANEDIQRFGYGFI